MFPSFSNTTWGKLDTWDISRKQLKHEDLENILVAFNFLHSINGNSRIYWNELYGKNFSEKSLVNLELDTKTWPHACASIWGIQFHVCSHKSNSINYYFFFKYCTLRVWLVFLRTYEMNIGTVAEMIDRYWLKWRDNFQTRRKMNVNWTFNHY